MASFTPQNTQSENVSGTSSVSFSYFKVFLWFALGLAITGVIAFALPDTLVFMANKLSWTEDVLAKVFMIMIIVSAILMIPSSILMAWKAWRPKSALMLVSYIVYAVAMGVLLSSVFLTVYADSLESNTSFIKTVSIAFFVTGGCFLLMGIIGAFTKKNLGILIPLVITLVIGTAVISLVNIFLKSSMVYWITDFVLFGVILVITAIDINRVKKIGENGGFSSETNLALYCAYSLYTDFISIFLRVLFYIMAHNKK